MPLDAIRQYSTVYCYCGHVNAVQNVKPDDDKIRVFCMGCGHSLEYVGRIDVHSRCRLLALALALSRVGGRGNRCRVPSAGRSAVRCSWASDRARAMHPVVGRKLRPLLDQLVAASFSSAMHARRSGTCRRRGAAALAVGELKPTAPIALQQAICCRSAAFSVSPAGRLGRRGQQIEE